MIIPAIITSLFLGIAFDMAEYSTRRIFIYDSADVESKLQVKPEDTLLSKYLVVHNTSDLIDFFELDPALALREKFSSLGLPYQKFFQSSLDRQKVFEIIFYVKCRLETRTFPSDTKVNTEWQTRRQKYVGTHFIKGITTGGNLLMSFQVQPLKSEYTEEVRNAIHTYLGNSGIIDENLIKKMENLSRALESKVSINRHTLTTGIGFSNPPSTMTEAARFALQLPTLVKNTGNGKGTPLDIEVEDLHTLASNFSEYKTNPDLVPVLREAFAKLDDIRVAKKEFQSWTSSHSLLPREQRAKINAFYRKITLAERAMASAVARLDISGPSSQFDAAFQAYGRGGGSDEYKTELHELMKSLG